MDIIHLDFIHLDFIHLDFILDPLFAILVR